MLRWPILLVSLVLATAQSVAGQQDAWNVADVAVVRLAPSEFPELPVVIVLQLEARGCTIPQGDWPRVPGQMGVISGEFLAPGRQSWAVVCSVERASAILVFDSSNMILTFDSQ